MSTRGSSQSFILVSLFLVMFQIFPNGLRKPGVPLPESLLKGISPILKSCPLVGQKDTAEPEICKEESRSNKCPEGSGKEIG